MKTRTLLLSIFVSFITITAFAQSSIGIPVQGIARDNNGTARINAPIILTFDLYYIEGGNEVLLYNPSQQENLTTDSFGVFSSIVNTNGRRSVFGSKEVFLRISESGTIISNEVLNSVPYAISANNGVPTGAVMPFVGTTAPEGWLLCDGAAIPNGLEYDALKTLHGPNTPNLQGLFLRGVGQYDANRVGPALGAVQGDQNKLHRHKIDQNTQTDGSHSHTVDDRYLLTTSDHSIGNGVTSTNENSIATSTARTTTSTAHSHNLLGNTEFHDQNGTITSGTESRPVNYGVNYIIKL